MATKKTSTKAKTKKSDVKNSSRATAVSKKARPSLKVKMASLKRWNIIIAVLLVAQALAVFVIGKAVTLPIVTRYLANDTLASQAAGHSVLAPAVRHMFFIDIRYIVVAYLLVSAIIAWLIGTIRHRSYEAELQKSVNTMRWIDYGLSSSIMLALIAMLNGVYDSATLLAILVLVALLHFLGYFGEAKAMDLRAKLQIFAAICVAGAAVWLIIASYLKGAIFYANGLNHYVYWIDGSIFVAGLGLAYNKLQVFRAKGKWADYIFGERLFMGLSFLAKTALTWLVFVGFLR